MPWTVFLLIALAPGVALGFLIFKYAFFELGWLRPILFMACGLLLIAICVSVGLRVEGLI